MLIEKKERTSTEKNEDMFMNNNETRGVDEEKSFCQSQQHFYSLDFWKNE